MSSLARGLLFGLMILPDIAAAQSAGDFTEAARSPLRYTIADTHPRRACAALRDEGGGDLTIMAAELARAPADGPEYCRITGVIAPEIQFEIDLPTGWNRRFYMFGNGGYAGEDLNAPIRQTLSANALRAGFVTAQTNTGHDAAREPLATFAPGSLQKTIDYAFRAVHRTVVAAKALADAYYGRPVTFSYWDSCSTGGRQGLMSAQRFPEDFDGIIAGAPVRNFVDTMVNYVWNAQSLDGVGLSVAKMKTVAEGAYARCDAQDGLRDGLIEDPRKCDFAPARDIAQCKAGEDGETCLTAAQAAAIEKIYAGITLPDGKKFFFGWPKGAEVLGPAFDGSQVSGWDQWFIGSAGQPSRQTLYMTSFMQNMAFGRAEPDFDWRKFDFQKDLPRIAPAIRQLLVPDDAELAAFRRHGGKLIMYHGWADTALTPFMSVDYYERALAANGKDTGDFFRLFMIPGMAHCRGGVATDRFDAISTMVDWVEAGTPPDSIAAARMQDGRVNRTRPLCPYPQVAAYAGSGSIDDAANFACKDPR
jgi:feruloyl esterase